ncbi:uncharacterized protein BJ212DRAFT_1302312 [Suillus subaureus]|uniref:Uncharacterized protein n=1 Tax=Suillus subaureus TaxID=48587 RepID=A0A9P7JAA4_9AGAM|nr:uncharacterized protein BJ212DRAFT_1302312 [Suillus subaureus]KAG1810563.1 hypothetical protein BJ212DRAFT_1302312 [Suillus subaureus]
MNVQVDALGDNEKTDDEVGLQSNARLTKLDVGDSPVTYAGLLRSSPELTTSIPQFLHAMAPKLKSVKDGAWSNGTYESPWKVVSYALQMMVTDEEGLISDRKPHPLNPQFFKRGRRRHRVTGAALEKSKEEELSDNHSMSIP